MKKIAQIDEKRLKNKLKEYDEKLKSLNQSHKHLQKLEEKFILSTFQLPLS